MQLIFGLLRNIFYASFDGHSICINGKWFLMCLREYFDIKRFYLKIINFDIFQIAFKNRL